MVVNKAIVLVCGTALLLLLNSCACSADTPKCQTAEHVTPEHALEPLNASEAKAVAYCSRLLPDCVLEHPICCMTIYSHMNDAMEPVNSYRYGVLGSDDGYGLLSIIMMTGAVTHSRGGSNMGENEAGTISLFPSGNSSSAEWTQFVNGVLSALEPGKYSGQDDTPFLDAVQLWRIATKHGDNDLANKTLNMWRMTLPEYRYYFSPYVVALKFPHPHSIDSVLVEECHDSAFMRLFMDSRVGVLSEARARIRMGNTSDR